MIMRKNDLLQVVIDSMKCVVRSSGIWDRLNLSAFFDATQDIANALNSHRYLEHNVLGVYNDRMRFKMFPF